MLIGGVLVVFGVLLSGCEMGDNLPQNQEMLAPERPGVTLKGKLSASGNTYFVSDGAKTTEITSRKVDLKSKVGSEVEVYGEFSGTTLYVDEIK